MTNFEKYKEDILSITKNDNDIAFDRQKDRIVSCPNHHCRDCLFNNRETGCHSVKFQWLYAEATEVDWTTIPVDTKIYVRDRDDQSWKPRYFSHYDSEYNTVYAFADGATSWSVAAASINAVCWRQVKLAEEDEES